MLLHYGFQSWLFTFPGTTLNFALHRHSTLRTNEISLFYSLAFLPSLLSPLVAHLYRRTVSPYSKLLLLAVVASSCVTLPLLLFASSRLMLFAIGITYYASSLATNTMLDVHLIHHVQEREVMQTLRHDVDSTSAALPSPSTPLLAAQSSILFLRQCMTVASLVVQSLVELTPTQVCWLHWIVSAVWCGHIARDRGVDNAMKARVEPQSRSLRRPSSVDINIDVAVVKEKLHPHLLEDHDQVEMQPLRIDSDNDNDDFDQKNDGAIDVEQQVEGKESERSTSWIKRAAICWSSAPHRAALPCLLYVLISASLPSSSLVFTSFLLNNPTASLQSYAHLQLFSFPCQLIGSYVLYRVGQTYLPRLPFVVRLNVCSAVAFLCSLIPLVSIYPLPSYLHFFSPSTTQIIVFCLAALLSSVSDFGYSSLIVNTSLPAGPSLPLLYTWSHWCQSVGGVISGFTTQWLMYIWQVDLSQESMVARPVEAYQQVTHYIITCAAIQLVVTVIAAIVLFRLWHRQSQG